LTPPSKGTPDRGEPVEKGAVPRRIGRKPCIPSAKSRKIPLPYDKTLYKQRQKIEIKKIGGASPPVTTVAPTPSSQASASLHRSPSTSINES
jgi:hypothetical protein